MRGWAWLALIGAWGSAGAALVACGDAFSTGAASGEDGGHDAAGDVTAGGDAGTDGAPGGGGHDASAEVGHADAPPPADGPVHGDAASDGIVVQDVVTVDVVTLDVVTGSPKRVFVTSTTSNGDLGGLSGADSTCQHLADAVALGGTYKAWLSTTTISAASRLTHSTTPYVLINGTKIASSWAGLTSGTLLAPINVNEKGGPPPTVPSTCGVNNASIVWTSTNPNGAVGTTLGATCAEWTTSGSSNGAVVGFADRVDGSWTAGCAAQGAGSLFCATDAALYCFEQ